MDLSVVDQYIDLLEFNRQTTHKSAQIVHVTDVELNWQDLDAVAHLFDDICRDLLETVDAACSKDDLEVLGRSSCEFELCRLADA